jgi:putative flavoprotein involved in K+ transport
VLAHALIVAAGMSTQRRHYPVIIVGAGQAGLAMSYCLKRRGIEHLVLERYRLGHAWREQRWDSFCLVTPNWQCRLPGHPYNGVDPQGFMRKEEIVRYLEAYASSFAPPLLEGVTVTRVGRKASRAFALETSLGELTADQVVIAAGGYHVPKIPKIAERLPASIAQLNVAQYRSAAQLPKGAVMVVGSGQSGCQIAEDLHLEGRTVHLCTGSAPRVARRYRGKDVVEWLDLMGHYELPIDNHPDGKGVRKKANHYVTGRDGGRDIDLRKFAREGMQLHGRLQDITERAFVFGDDLGDNLDRADATNNRIKDNIDAFIVRERILAPPEPRPAPLWQPSAPCAPLDFAAANVSAVIWCMGFAIDFRWIELPIFDAHGYPDHDRGVTGEHGLYFLGLPWLYTWGSGRFVGVGRDAEYLGERIANTLEPTQIRALA